jgi:hypothetical protein
MRGADDFSTLDKFFLLCLKLCYLFRTGLKKPGFIEKQIFSQVFSQNKYESRLQ